MLDPHLLRNDLDHVVKKLARRGFSVDAEKISGLEVERKKLQSLTQSLQNDKNTSSKKIGKAKKNGEDIQPLLDNVAQFGEKLKTAELELGEIQNSILEIVSTLPNLPDDSVPDGQNENDNIEIRLWGTPKYFDFSVKDHVDLGVRNGLLDFDLGAKITGSRFTVMRGPMARLHRALIQFMLDVHTTEHGYVEVNVPYIVNSESLHGTGQLPKFEADLFKLNGDQEYYLIPTGEVPVTNIVRDTITDFKELPLKFVSHTPCFRSEAGSYGKDTRGMIRQHQFEKVELVQMVHPDNSFKVLEEITNHAEEILKRLDLPYRVVNLCTGDISFSATKTYDLEVWLPGQACYREISSVSNFIDFQARRLKARWRNPDTNKPELIHTLNGSALAIGRTLVAIIENYQQEDGVITIPEVLIPYMGGLTEM
ncbi:MAG: serine--tRNA ligase [Thiohalomonadales bacterium]